MRTEKPIHITLQGSQTARIDRLALTEQIREFLALRQPTGRVNNDEYFLDEQV